MTLFKKINRGLILTVVVLIVTAGYVILTSVAQSAAEPDIKNICANYIKTAISYQMLPQNYRKETPAMPKTELDNYINSMSKDLEAFYTTNQQTYKYTIDSNKTSLENQAKGIGVIYSYSKVISSYNSFTFSSDTVEVSISTSSVLDDASDPSTSAGGRQSISSQTTDTIDLQKVGGKWKITYADLEQPSNGGVQDPNQPNTVG